jgi:hypothetical protein
LDKSVTPPAPRWAQKTARVGACLGNSGNLLSIDKTHATVNINSEAFRSFLQAMLRNPVSELSFKSGIINESPTFPKRCELT